jgi:hypothetical protein
MDLPFTANPTEGSFFVRKNLASNTPHAAILSQVIHDFDQQSIFRKEQSFDVACTLYQITDDASVKEACRSFLDKYKDGQLPLLNQAECAGLRVLRKLAILSLYPDLGQRIETFLQTAPEMVRFVQPPTAFEQVFPFEIEMHERLFSKLKGFTEPQLTRWLTDLMAIEQSIKAAFVEARSKLSDSEQQICGFETYGVGGPADEREIDKLVRQEQFLEDSKIYLGSAEPRAHERSSPFDALSTDELERRGNANRARLAELRKLGKLSPADQAEKQRLAEQEFEIPLAASGRASKILASELPFWTHLAGKREASLKAIVKVQDMRRELLPALASISLTLNCLLFAYLVRRKFLAEHWTREAHVVYLYAVPAALFPIVLLLAVITAVSDYGHCYDVSWLSACCAALIGGLAIWALLSLWTVGQKLARLNQAHGEASSARALSSRLVLSNICTNVVMSLALTALSGAILHVLYLRVLRS